MTKSILAVSFAVIAVLAATDSYAERAASIEYDFTSRPVNLPQSVDALAGVALRFLAIKAIDGSRLDAALWQAASKPAAMTTLSVGVHGSGGNFFSGSPMASVSPLLAEKGYGVMTISMRWHDEGRDADNFFDGRRDIEAAVYTARALGYQTLVLWGHSLGSIHVQFHAANTWDRDTKAVVLSGMFANLPWKSRHMLVQNEDAFRALSEAAMKSLREGKEREFLSLRMRGAASEAQPLTGQHFLTYRTEASSAADSTYWIKRVPRPILMLRDAGDATIAPFEPYMLLSAATSPGSLVPSIKYVVLPNPMGINPRGHQFLDNRQPLVEAITGWLSDQHL
jgi:pimeloyl-ACP methyl ester carboxylesterase